MIFGCIPVKSPDRAKERLKHYLSSHQRAALARSMFEDVVTEARKVRSLDRLVVVSNDAHILVVAAGAGATVLVEGEQRSHGASADWAAKWCMDRGALSVLFIPIDVPLVRAAEIESLVQESRKLPKPHMVIVPSSDGTGTNAMLRTPPNLFESRFGPNSFSIHVAAAENKNAAVKVMRPEGLLFDLDEPADLSLFLSRNPTGRTAQLLEDYREARETGQTNGTG